MQLIDIKYIKYLIVNEYKLYMYIYDTSEVIQHFVIDTRVWLNCMKI